MQVASAPVQFNYQNCSRQQFISLTWFILFEVDLKNDARNRKCLGEKDGIEQANHGQ